MLTRPLHFPTYSSCGVYAATGVLIASVTAVALSQEHTAVTIDFAQVTGLVRALHGVNKGPLAIGHDLTPEHTELRVPYTRLHDCHWPEADVVDIHVLFPDFNADPAQPASYNFKKTDEYLAAIVRTGAQIIFRLGESIEHGATKRFVHPPPDASKWARICLGIIRHYNEGWANGYQHHIRYWEIWNEPENRPAMWTGTDEEFLGLYAAAARTIKEQFPELKVGGPGVGHLGKFHEGRLELSGFVSRFLDFCKTERAPLDFFSWHCYTDKPLELVARAREVRRTLNAHSFLNTESHLNEWNYLPRKDWGPVMPSAPAAAQREAFAQIAGRSGAAFIISGLIELQNAPVDICNLFHGEAGGFGLVTESGARQGNYFGLRSFAELLNTPVRVQTPACEVSLCAGISKNGQHAQVLLSNFSTSNRRMTIRPKRLPWRGQTWREVQIDAALEMPRVERSTNAAPNTEVSFELPAHSIARVSWQTVR